MLQFQHLTLARGARELISDIDFTLYQGQKIGITGNNGCGKSSLFSVITGELSPAAGDIAISNGTRLSMIEQNIPQGSQTVIDYVIAGDEALYQLKLQIDNNTAPQDAIATLYTQYEEQGGYQAKTKAAKLLKGLGFSDAKQGATLDELSGGWRVRANIARALFTPCDLLLLDEPTNHLDLEAVLWLEGWLQRFPGTVLTIAHDRDFLDAICSHIIHIAGGEARLYSGNYSIFENTREQQLLLQEKMVAKQEKVRAHLQSFVDRFQAKASKAKQAQSRIKALNKLDTIALLQADRNWQIAFLPPEQTANPLIQLQKATLGYEDATILRNVSLTIGPTDRIGLLGLNGSGKSTLVKSLAGALPLQQGKYNQHPNCRIGYFAQYQLENLDAKASPYEIIKRAYPTFTETNVRSLLGNYGFIGDHIFTTCEKLSGGEKARLVLALIIQQKPNCLILDEPTNHLDLEIRESLTLALQNFAGSLIVIAHDRHLLRHTCDEFYLVDNGAVTRYEGDLNDYTSALTKPLKAVDTAINIETSTLSNQQRKEAQRKLGQLERTIESTQAKVSTLETKLADPSLYEADDSSQVETLSKELRSLQNKLAEDEEQYFQLLEQLD